MSFQSFKPSSPFLVDVKTNRFSSFFGRIPNNYNQTFEFGLEDDGYGIIQDQFQLSSKDYF